MHELKEELSYQRHTRDYHEMKQLKLHRIIDRLTKTENEAIEIIKKNDKEKLIAEVS